LSINNLKQIGNALEMYSQGSKGQCRPHGILANGRHATFDPAAAFDALFNQGHLTDPRVWVSPYDEVSTLPENGKPMWPNNTSYAYIYVSHQYSTASAVAFEKPWSLPDGHNQIAILYADGHVACHTVPGVSRMSCRELIESNPQIFGFYPDSDISFADTIDSTRPQRQ
jgi:prepilin-type processing-associated H-X9-DG protein